MILINTLLLSFGYLVVAEEFTRNRHVPISLKTTDDLFLIAHGPEIIFKLGLPFDALSIRFLIVIVEPVSIADDEAHTPVTLLVVAENLICGVPPRVIRVPSRRNRPRSAVVGVYRSSCARAIVTQSTGITTVASPGELQRNHCNRSDGGNCLVLASISTPIRPKGENVGYAISFKK